MGYAEEIFERAESQLGNLRTKESILDWLRRSPNGQITRRASSTITNIANELAEPFELDDEVDDVTSVEEFKEFTRKRDALTFGRGVTSEEYVQERRIAIAESLADVVRTPETAGVYKEAIKGLREIDSRKLGGLKRGEQQKALKSLRDLF